MLVFKAVQNLDAVFFRRVIAVFKDNDGEEIGGIFRIDEAANHHLQTVFVAQNVLAFEAVEVHIVVFVFYLKFEVMRIKR